MLDTIEALALIPTVFLLMVIVSQYVILAFKPKKIKGNFKPDISIIIPAHNEGKHLRKTINSILNSGYKGKNEIIVIDDGSTDDTPKILEEFKKNKLIKSIRTNHIGKSKALNKGLKLAKYGIIVTLDGDTEIEKNSLEKLLDPLRNEKVAATTGAIKVANNKKILTWFQRVEYLYYSLYKSLCDRIDGVICASGTFSAIKRKYFTGELFNSKLYSEDIDLTLNLIKNGYKVRYVPEAVSYTFVPEGVKGLAKQRTRWCRGCIQVMKKHSNLFFNRKHLGPGFYSLPLLSYWYFHALVMGILLLLQIVLGYYSFYYINGNIISFEVLKYFFYWFSSFGVVNLAYQMIIGNFQVKLLYILNLLVVALTYAIYLYSIKWSKERITVKDVFVFIFFFPYWVLIMIIQGLSNVEWFKSKANNLWTK